MKKIAKILSVVLCMVMVLGMMATTTFAAETQSADLDTMALATSAYVTSTSSLGWKAENAQVINSANKGSASSATMLGNSKCVVLNGKTSAVGKLTSPELNGGIKELSFSYGNLYSESNGVDVTITVTPVGGTAVTKKLDDNSVTINTAETFTWTLDTPVEGNFTISIKNNSPTNSTKNKDRVSIWNVTWVSAAAQVHTHDYENGTVTYAPKNDYQHTVTKTCADSTCTVPATSDEYHSYDANAKCTACEYQYVTPETKTIAEALQIAETAGSSYTTEKYTITGTITEIANDYYGNVYISDGTNSLYVYGLYSMYGVKKHGDWAEADKLAVGDTITIHTVLGAYTGSSGTTLQGKNAWVASVTRAGTDTPPAGDDDDDKDDDVVVTPPAGGTGSATGTAPVAGGTYKLGLWQASLKEYYYFAGTVANKDYYMQTTADFAAATDVTVEAVEGGYRLSFMDGSTKKYLDIYVSGTYVNARITDAPTAVYTWNATHKTFVANINGTEYYLGTYTSFNDDGSIKGDYTTLSASKLSYLSGDSSYPTHFYAEQPAKTGDISSVFVALLAVSAIGAGALISKKGKFVA